MMIYLVILHAIVGVFLKYYPPIVTFFYVGAFAWMVFDVIRTKDRDSRAGFYALYLMGYEISYRMGGFYLAWELGKYLSVLMLAAGLIFTERKRFPYIFLLLLILLLPSIFLTTGRNINDIRKDVLFNISGPLSLVFSGMYFYRRPIELSKFYDGLRIAFLPAFVIAVGINLRASIASLEFDNLASSVSASGGFGANQVSTGLGWFVLMVAMFKVQGKKITPFQWLDYLMLCVLMLRGLLTFSRGGIMGAVLALVAAVAFYLLVSSEFRKRMIKVFPYIVVGFMLIIATILYANKVTNNFLMYRYLGYSTNEMRDGVKDKDRSVLTGRGELMEGDMAAFRESPLFGVGYGMALRWHARYFGEEVVAHTEYTRLLAENGLLGLIYMMVAFVILPMRNFFDAPNIITRYFFLAFFIIGAMTMFHAAMRMAIPGVLIGASMVFLYETNSKKELKNIKSVEE